MMLICIYHMITNGERFNPCDYEELINPNPIEPKVTLTLETALSFISAQGIDISVLNVSSND